MFSIGDHVMYGNKTLIISGVEPETSGQPAVYHLHDENGLVFGSAFAEQLKAAAHRKLTIKNVRRVNFDTSTDTSTDTHKRNRTHSSQRGGKRATRRNKNKSRKARRKTNRRR